MLPNDPTSVIPPMTASDCNLEAVAGLEAIVG